MERVLVRILRRDPEELTTEEVATIEQAFPGKEVSFQRTDPRDYLEHDALCQQLEPAVVILPRERPIPSLAMERGVRHVIVTPGGLQELLPLVPQFKPFTSEA